MARDRGFSLLSILVATIIVAFLYYLSMKIYFSSSGPGIADDQTRETLMEQGIDTSDYGKMIDSTRKSMDDLQKRLEDQEKKVRALD